MYIARYQVFAVLLLMLSALAPAIAQNVVHNGDVSTIGIQPQPGDTYTWELYSDSTVNFATTPGDPSPAYASFIGNTNSSTVSVKWNKPGHYFFRVNALNVTGCTSNLKVGEVKVLEALPTAVITDPLAICAGETVSLTVTLTGTGPWEMTVTDGINSWTETEPSVAKTPPEVIHTIVVTPPPVLTTDFRITEIKDKYGINTTGSNTVTQTVNPLPKPSSIYHR